jgi:hypothetical protein
LEVELPQRQGLTHLDLEFSRLYVAVELMIGLPMS